jgi:WhiB family redox-sensing transcriptional regulator
MTNWRNNAACQGSKVDFFGTTIAEKEKAKAVCAVCPVRQQCLDYAMSVEVNEETGVKLGEDHRFGVFGGLTRNERWELDYPERAKQQRERNRVWAAQNYERMTPEQRKANRGNLDTERARELKRARDRAAYDRRKASVA